MPEPVNKRPTPAQVKALKAEIAERYRKKQSRPVVLADLVIAQLQRLFAARFCNTWPLIPTYARKDGKIVLHYLAHCPNSTRRAYAWRDAHMPYVPDEEVERILHNPQTWTAAQVGTLLGLTPEEREQYGITTIRPRSTTDAEMKQRAKQRRNERRRGKRQVRGGKSRQRYEGESLNARKPWVAAGISKRTWHRRQVKQRGQE